MQLQRTTVLHACLLLVYAGITSTARAQVHTPGDAAGYADALADSALTQIKITNHITLPAGTYEQTSTNAITFESADEGQYTLTGGGIGSDYRAYFTSVDLEVLRNLTFFNFSSAINGGALNIGGSVLDGMSNIRFEANTAEVGGGGFFVEGNFSGDISGVVFTDNEAGFNSGGGGGFRVLGNFAADILNDTRFEGNIGIQGDVVGDFKGAIRDAIFQSNEAGVDGGGFRVNGDFTGDIRDTVFEGNTAGQDGGGFYLDVGDFIGNIRDTAFEGNTAGQDGGGFSMPSFTGNIRDTVFKGNTAGNDGGGFYAGDFTGDIQDTVFENV